MEDKPTYTGMNEAKPNMPDSIPAPPPFPADNAELRIVAGAERALLLKTMAERDALAALANQYKGWLDAVYVWAKQPPARLALLPEWQEVLRRIAEARDYAPAVSLAAHDAAVWREAARMVRLGQLPQWSNKTTRRILEICAEELDKRAAELEAKGAQAVPHE